MSSNESEQGKLNHPNPIDRNRSITWARYYMDSNEWVLLSLKVTKRTVESGVEQPSVVTVALLDHSGKTLLECMVKAPHMVSNDEIAKHGVNYSVVYNAKPYEQIIADLIQIIGSREIVAWDCELVQKQFDDLGRFYGAPIRKWKIQDACSRFVSFVGIPQDIKNGYDAQPLPVSVLSAVEECRTVRKQISEMAAGNQVTDQVACGKPGWTAEFYKPKLTPKDKIKGMFGFHS